MPGEPESLEERDRHSASGGPRGWYRRRLPHIDVAGLEQAITIRLADSMPKNVLDEWGRELRLFPPEEVDLERRLRIERYLDAGSGCCWLRQPRIASIVEESLLHWHRRRYDLLAWCVMPNHLHLLIRQYDSIRLDDVLASLKKHTAKEANRLLGRSGRFWYREYFDRYMRDAEHRWKTIWYIEQNPVAARLCMEPSD